MIVQYSSSQIIYRNITILVTMWLTLIHNTGQTQINPHKRGNYPCAYAWLIFNNKDSYVFATKFLYRDFNKVSASETLKFEGTSSTFSTLMFPSSTKAAYLQQTCVLFKYDEGKLHLLWSKPFEHPKTNAGWCNFTFKPLCCSRFTVTKNNTLEVPKCKTHKIICKRVTFENEVQEERPSSQGPNREVCETSHQNLRKIWSRNKCPMSKHITTYVCFLLEHSKFSLKLQRRVQI